MMTWAEQRCKAEIHGSDRFQMLLQSRKVSGEFFLPTDAETRVSINETPHFLSHSHLLQLLLCQPDILKLNILQLSKLNFIYFQLLLNSGHPTNLLTTVCFNEKIFF